MNVQISVKESVNLVVVVVVINVYLFGTAKQRGNAAFFRCKPSLLSIISRCTQNLNYYNFLHWENVFLLTVK